MADEPENGRRHEERGPNGRRDPSSNVLDLVDAAVDRLNDLMDLDREHRADIDTMQTRHHAEIREMQKDLRIAETARIDAIRAVDVGAVQRAAEVQADVATALANQVALSAETLRNTVSETAIAGATALTQALDPLQTAINDLRKAQYEAQGQKAQVSETREVQGGASSNRGMWIGLAIAAAALVSTFFLGVAAIVVTLLLRG